MKKLNLQKERDYLAGLTKKVVVAESDTQKKLKRAIEVFGVPTERFLKDVKKWKGDVNNEERMKITVKAIKQIGLRFKKVEKLVEKLKTILIT